jgi:hypothetical protein
MESQVREHQVQLRRRLESIKRIHQASDTLDERLKELQHVRDGVDEQERLVASRIDGLRILLNGASALPADEGDLFAGSKVAQ